MLKEIRKRIQQGFIASGAPSLQSSVPPSPTSAEDLPFHRGIAAVARPGRWTRLLASAPGAIDSGGGYVSPYRGRGMEFEEVRAYQPGDDIRNMDWRVTARTGRPHTKLFREERERPVLFLVDLGPSMAFGTRVAFKSVVAARAAALLAWAARDNGDRIGGIVFAGKRHRELRPAARERGMLPFSRHWSTCNSPVSCRRKQERSLGRHSAAVGQCRPPRQFGLSIERLSWIAPSGRAIVCASRRPQRHDFHFDIRPCRGRRAARRSLPTQRRPTLCRPGYRRSNSGRRLSQSIRIPSRCGSRLVPSSREPFLTLATNQPVPETLRRGLIVHHRRPGARTTRP